MAFLRHLPMAVLSLEDSTILVLNFTAGNIAISQNHAMYYFFSLFFFLILFLSFFYKA